ncbi:CPK15, partial [Symbiodinium sp. CCMP2456]
ELEAVKAKAKELEDAKKAVKKQKAKKKEEKKRRKEENEIKGGQFQVVKKTEKVRKWHKNARKMLRTMSGEQIERLLTTNQY